MDIVEKNGKIDFMTVSPEATAFVARLFREYGFESPPPRNFGKRVESFCLDTPKKQTI